MADAQGSPARTDARPDWPGAAGSVALIAVGVAALLHARDFSDLGAVFPRAIGVLLIALGALYLVLVVAGRTTRAAAPAGSNLRRAGVAAVMLGWAYALPLGFVVSSIAAMTLLLLLAQHERWTAGRLLLYACAVLGVLALLYALFKLALQVPLP